MKQWQADQVERALRGTEAAARDQGRNDPEIMALVELAREIRSYAPPAPEPEFVDRLGLLLAATPPPARTPRARPQVWLGRLCPHALVAAGAAACALLLWLVVPLGGSIQPMLWQTNPGAQEEQVTTTPITAILAALGDPQLPPVQQRVLVQEYTTQVRAALVEVPATAQHAWITEQHHHIDALRGHLDVALIERMVAALVPAYAVTAPGEPGATETSRPNTPTPRPTHGVVSPPRGLTQTPTSRPIQPTSPITAAPEQDRALHPTSAPTRAATRPKASPPPVATRHPSPVPSRGVRPGTTPTPNAVPSQPADATDQPQSVTPTVIAPSTPAPAQDAGVPTVTAVPVADPGVAPPAGPAPGPSPAATPELPAPFPSEQTSPERPQPSAELVPAPAPTELVPSVVTVPAEPAPSTVSVPAEPAPTAPSERPMEDAGQPAPPREAGRP